MGDERVGGHSLDPLPAHPLQALLELLPAGCPDVRGYASASPTAPTGASAAASGKPAADTGSAALGSKEQAVAVAASWREAPRVEARWARCPRRKCGWGPGQSDKRVAGAEGGDASRGDALSPIIRPGYAGARLEWMLRHGDGDTGRTERRGAT